MGDQISGDDLRSMLHKQGYCEIARLLPHAGCGIEECLEIMADALTAEQRTDLTKAFLANAILGYTDLVTWYHQLGICFAPSADILRRGRSRSTFTAMGKLLIVHLAKTGGARCARPS